MTVPFSACALYSTTEDLLKWEHGLFGRKLLSARSLKEMTTPFKENYAFGLVVTRVNGIEKVEHGGGIEGFNADVAYWPESRQAVIVLGNLNGRAPGDIAKELAAAMH